VYYFLLFHFPMGTFCFLIHRMAYSYSASCRQSFTCPFVCQGIVPWTTDDFLFPGGAVGSFGFSNWLFEKKVQLPRFSFETPACA
jgi:hypothetical protein